MHYEVEVTPNPESGMVFSPVRGDDGPIRYLSITAATSSARFFREHGREIGGYRVRVVEVVGDARRHIAA